MFLKVIGFVCLTLFLVFLLLLIGASYGLQIAVDESKSVGFFRAYGKKYKAIEIKDNG